MALDHALAETIGAAAAAVRASSVAGAAGGVPAAGPHGPEAALRLYTWARPTVSFGRNEPAGGPEAWAGRADAFVRRPTGGRAVLHAAELTYAAVVPARALGGVRAAYRAVNEAIVVGLRALGVDARLVGGADGRGPVAPLDAGPCFGSPAPGEIVVGGRKLVGSAQARIGGALLQHGSILLEDGQGLLGAGATPAGTGAVGLRELVPGTSAEDVRAAVEEGFRARFGGAWEPGPAGPAEEARAERLERERYARSGWTWRR